jgi:hypothetical protein
MVVNEVSRRQKAEFGVANCIDGPMRIASLVNWPEKL